MGETKRKKKEKEERIRGGAIRSRREPANSPCTLPLRCRDRGSAKGAPTSGERHHRCGADHHDVGPGPSRRKHRRKAEVESNLTDTYLQH